MMSVMPVSLLSFEINKENWELCCEIVPRFFFLFQFELKNSIQNECCDMTWILLFSQQCPYRKKATENSSTIVYFTTIFML